MPSDNPGTYNNANPQDYLFDNTISWNGDTQTYNSGPAAVPSHFTVDLGVMTTLEELI